MFDWDADLAEEQLTAVTHGPGPLLILAGAGTGKTRTLTARVARLVQTGVPAERILLLTFTRRAAADMTARAAALCHDRDATRRMWSGTFHSVAHRLISEHAAQLGLSRVTVLDPADVVELLDLLRTDHDLVHKSGAARMPRSVTIADICSRAVNTGRPAREVIETSFPWCVRQTEKILVLLKDFVRRKRSDALLDFDDLLLGWRALLADPVLGAKLRARWDHVLVDEYQDVNRIQVDIVSGLCPDGRGLTVVGDDAQAIYGFRGATSEHLLDLADLLPDAEVVRLERNFRSRQPVLDLANVLRPGADAHRLQLTAQRGAGGSRPGLVRCYDAGEEARQIADTVLTAVENGQRLRDQAVLMRSAHHSDLLELELTARGVPFVKYGGLKFLEAAHVKDFLALLRVVQNPTDEVAWFRVLRLHQGVGPARSRALLPLVANEEMDRGSVVATAPAPARTALDATLVAVAAARSAAEPAGLVQTVAGTASRLVGAHYADSAARLADLERLAGAAAVSSDLAEFVAGVTLDPPASSADYAKPPHLDEDYLVLSTVHSAKGLEWDSVHVIHAVDGAFPSDMALSTPEELLEEQRLFYVAVTRARNQLAVYTPLRMPHHRRALDDRHSLAPASRFLDDRAVAVMDVREVPGPGARAGVGGRADVEAAQVLVQIPALQELFD